MSTWSRFKCSSQFKVLLRYFSLFGVLREIQQMDTDLPFSIGLLMRDTVTLLMTRTMTSFDIPSGTVKRSPHI